MPARGYTSSGSSRASTPSPRSNKSYLEPLSIQKEPKTKQNNSYYPPTYPSPPHTTLMKPRADSSSTYAHPSSSRSSSKSSSSFHPHTTTSNRKSKSHLKPLSIHQDQQQYQHQHDRESYTSPRDDIRSDKRQDSRYYPNSFLESSPKTHSSALRKEMDGRYYPNSSF